MDLMVVGSGVELVVSSVDSLVVDSGVELVVN